MLAFVAGMTVQATPGAAQATAATGPDSVVRTAAWHDGRTAATRVPIGTTIGTAFLGGAALPVGLMVMPIPLAGATSTGLAWASQAGVTEPPPELVAWAGARGESYRSEFREGYVSKLSDRRRTAAVFSGIAGLFVGIGLVACCLNPGS